MNARVLLACVLTAVCSPVWAAKRPVVVHDLFKPEAHLNAPQPIWRPDGEAFAYESDGKLWRYEIRSKKAKVWLNVSELHGSDESSETTSPKPFEWKNRRVSSAGPQWFPDGRRILIPTENGTAVARVGESKPVQFIRDIKAGQSPELSPDGSSVLLCRDNNLFVYAIGSANFRQLTFDGASTVWNGRLDWVYPEELDLGTAAWWSPDSKQIAYLQFDVSGEFVYPHADLLGLRAIFEPQRYPQAGTPNARVKVGIVTAAGGSSRWLSASDNRDDLIARVHWLPNSSELAVERLNRVQSRLDLLLISADGSSVRTLLTEQDKYWLNTSDDFRFLSASQQFIWSSERSGFRHLYLYSLGGGSSRQLTSGSWQVNRVIGVDDKQSQVFYTSAEDSPLEDKLYSLSLATGEHERISQTAGMHAIQMDPHARYYLDTKSSLSAMPECDLHRIEGKQIAFVKTMDRRGLSGLNVLPAEIVQFPATDGTTLYARLIRPADFNPKKRYPAVVFVYGGPQAQSVHNAWPGLTWEQVLASRGFAIWQVDNRGSYGRGHAFETPVYHQLGHIELADQLQGVKKLVSMGFVDESRIGIYGWSYGGYMTLYALLHEPNEFKAGIAGAPVADWHNYDTIYTERYMGLPAENEEGYSKSSNVRAAKNLEGKLMIVCNFEDDNVLFQNTMQMMTALHTANKSFQFLLYPQKTHGVTGDLMEGMLQQMTDFFVENLHPGS